MSALILEPQDFEEISRDSLSIPWEVETDGSHKTFYVPAAFFILPVRLRFAGKEIVVPRTPEPDARRSERDAWYRERRREIYHLLSPTFLSNAFLEEIKDGTENVFEAIFWIQAVTALGLGLSMFKEVKAEYDKTIERVTVESVVEMVKKRRKAAQDLEADKGAASATSPVDSIKKLISKILVDEYKRGFEHGRKQAERDAAREETIKTSICSTPWPHKWEQPHLSSGLNIGKENRWKG